MFPTDFSGTLTPLDQGQASGLRCVRNLTPETFRLLIVCELIAILKGPGSVRRNYKTQVTYAND